MQNSIYLGFDGGGTRTTGVAIDAGRSVLAQHTGEASNFQIIGVEQASANIGRVVDALLDKAGAQFASIQVIYLGLTGAGRISDADRMREGFLRYLERSGYRAPEVRIGSDAIAALEGAFSGEPGMILISGTGSILFAKDTDGRICRVGGWGRYIGDEGSGYALGRACLSAVAREFDGRGEKTLLSELLKESKGVSTTQSLIAEVYQNKLDIASLAPLVLQAADRGDPVAFDILANAATDLVEHIRAMIPKLKALVPIVFTGSLLSSDNLLSKRVTQLIRTHFPELKIKVPENPPAVGAALLALKAEAQK